MIDKDIVAQCTSLQDDELAVLHAIYPDRIRVHDNPLKKPGRLLTLTIPITLPGPTPISILTCQSQLRTPPPSSSSSISASASTFNSASTITSLSTCLPFDLIISHLPPLSLRVHLPPNYPLTAPPKPISLHARLPHTNSIVSGSSRSCDSGGDGTAAEWLDRALTGQLKGRVSEMWAKDKEMIGEGVGILWKWLEWVGSGDFLNKQTGILTLEIPPNMTAVSFHTMLKSYNAAQLHTFFENTAFSCSICLENRKGKSCVKLPCGCVFCNPCLNSCWTLAITEGSLESVSCPSISCTKERATRERHLSKPTSDPDGSCDQGEEVDRDLVESVVGKELTDRWISLKERRRAEIDPMYTICPRPSCQAIVPPPDPPTAEDIAAFTQLSKRSKTIRLSEISSPLTVSPISSPNTTARLITPTSSTTNPAAEEDKWARYRSCPSCHFSFCLYCSATWHGPHTPCAFPQMSAIVAEYLGYPEGSMERRRMEVQRGKANIQRLINKWEEEQQNRKWIEERTRQCAGCGVHVEKSHGCNHMTCNRCQAHFCYRCGESISPKDPYAHFNRPGHACFEKLFDIEEIQRFDREFAQGGGLGGFQVEGLVGDEDDWRPVRGVWEW